MKRAKGLLIASTIFFQFACQSPSTSTSPSRDRDRAVQETAPPGVTSSSHVASTASALAEAPWLLGERYTYRFKLTSVLKFGEAVPAFDFDITGTMAVAPSRRSPDESTDLFVVLIDPNIESRVPGTKEQLTEVAKQLANFGCYVTLKAGRVIEIHLAPASPAMVVSIYRELASALQFAPDIEGQPTYEAQEYDGTGQYTAQYRRTDVGQYVKRKLRYLNILAKGTAASSRAVESVIPQILRSEGAIQLSPARRPVHVELQNELQVNGAQLPLSSSTSVSLQAGDTSHDAPVKDWRDLREKLVLLPASEPFGSTASIESLDDARIRGATLETLLQKLDSNTLRRSPSASAPRHDGQEAVSGDDAAVFVALAALFRKDPTSAARAMRRAQSNPRIANSLIDALGSSGSPSAHAVLAQMLVEKDVAPALRLRALTGLARTPVPSVVAVDALKDELKRSPFSTGALYGLGSYAQYYRDSGEPAKEKEIGDLLIARLNDANDIVPRLIVTLGGLTNAGYDGALGAIVSHLNDRRAGVRAAAVRALQFMRGTDVDTIIASTMTSDAELPVTLAALDATEAREPSDKLVQALVSVAEKSLNPNARFKSVDLLGRWKKQRPDVRDVIQRIAKNDPEERVRDLAQSAL